MWWFRVKKGPLGLRALTAFQVRKETKVMMASQEFLESRVIEANQELRVIEERRVTQGKVLRGRRGTGGYKGSEDRRGLWDRLGTLFKIHQTHQVNAISLIYLKISIAFEPSAVLKKYDNMTK